MKTESVLKYDTVVVGGGSAGISAAASAAKNGSRVLLIEAGSVLGGEMLSGMTIDGAVNARGERIVGGILDELIEELKLMDGYVGIFNDWRLIRYICIDPVVMQMAVMKVLSKYGVEILLHSVMEDVIVRDGTVEKIVIYNKKGKSYVEAGNFIDCSGDGDLCAMAGAPYELASSDGELQPVSLMFRMSGVETEPLLRFVREHPEYVAIGESDVIRDGRTDKVIVEELYKQGQPTVFFKGDGPLLKEAINLGELYPTALIMIQPTSIARKEVCINSTRVAHINALDTKALSNVMEELLDQLVIENSIQPFLHTMYCAPCIENGELKGIIVENKNGRQAILAKFFIDASGDGDLAHDLGLPSYTHDIMQPPTPTFKLIGDLSGINLKNLLQEYGSEFGLPEDWGWGGPVPSVPNLFFRADTHVFNVDCSNADDLTYAEIEGRKQIKAVMQILEKYGGKKDNPARIAAICSHIGIRETRHFNSDYKLNQHDILYGIKFDDAIANGTYRVDIHHSKGAGITFRSLDGEEIIFNDRTGPPIKRRWRKDNGYAEYYQVPFRALVQKKFANLIIAGRMINADEGAFGAVRVMVNLNQIGEAAGVAAYIAVSTDKEIWNIDTNLLRNELKKGGSIIL